MKTASLWAALALCLFPACNGCNNTQPPAPRTGQPNLQWCPGSPGCMPEGEAQLHAGAAKRSIIPRGFEVANPHYMKSTNCDPIYLERFGVSRCGELPDFDPPNCGTDGLCPGDMGYTAPDGDGTEADQPVSGVPNSQQDWFMDCGLDRICGPLIGGRARTVPANTPEPEALRSNGIDDDGDGAIDEGEYPGPDEGEGDGIFQAAWIAGFGGNRAAMGVYGDIDVRCFALRTNQTTTVFCSLDVVGFMHEEIERARIQLKADHPDTDVDYLAVASTHTHENVDTMGQWGRQDPVPITPGRLKGHNAFIVTQIVEAANEAVHNLQPARLVMTKTKTGADGYLRDSRDPQVMDDTMTLVEAQSEPAHQAIFTAIHWANHPEVLSDDINFLSADYSSVLRTRVEQGFPDRNLAGRGGMAIYINGTVGGLLTPLGVHFSSPDGVDQPTGQSRLARLEAYGQNLAIKALTALKDNEASFTTVTTTEIKVKAQQFFILVKNRVFIFGFSAGLFDRKVYDEPTGNVLDPETNGLLDDNGDSVASARTEVFTLDVGPWSLTGVPGEMFTEVAMGGYDGTLRQGRDLVSATYCRPQSECPTTADCPVTRPANGWENCDCEQCRICEPPSMSAAPAGPYLVDRMPGAFKVVVGLANDELGYLVPPYDFKVSEVAPYFCQHGGDHYEETNSTGDVAVPRVEAALKVLFDYAL